MVYSEGKAIVSSLHTAAFSNTQNKQKHHQRKVPQMLNPFYFCFMDCNSVCTPPAGSSTIYAHPVPQVNKDSWSKVQEASVQATEWQDILDSGSKHWTGTAKPEKFMWLFEGKEQPRMLTKNIQILNRKQWGTGRHSLGQRLWRKKKKSMHHNPSPSILTVL